MGCFNGNQDGQPVNTKENTAEPQPNILQRMQNFGQTSGLGGIVKILADAGQETNHPGYLQRQQQIDMGGRQIAMRQQNNDLNAQLSVIASLPAGSEAQKAAMESLKNNPVIGGLIGSIQGKKLEGVSKNKDPLIRAGELAKARQNLIEAGAENVPMLDKDGKPVIDKGGVPVYETKVNPKMQAALDGIDNEIAGLFSPQPDAETQQINSAVDIAERKLPSITDRKVYDKNTRQPVADYFSEDQSQQEITTPQQNAETAPEKAKSGILKNISSFFQGSTPALPTENTKKSFKQLGIESPQDQQTLQDMQKDVPEVDMKQELQDDPEGFKRLMEMYKQGKINKSNLKKAFSMMQQQAKSTLGIA
jgi:hypothetical protein